MKVRVHVHRVLQVRWQVVLALFNVFRVEKVLSQRHQGPYRAQPASLASTRLVLVILCAPIVPLARKLQQALVVARIAEQGSTAPPVLGAAWSALLVVTPLEGARTAHCVTSAPTPRIQGVRTALTVL